MDANTWLVRKIWATSFWEPSYIESHKIYIPCRSCDSTCMFHFFSGWISSLSQNYWHTALCRQRSSEHIQIARRRSCYGISTSVLLLMGDSSAYYLRNMFFVLVEILRLPPYHRSSLGAYGTCWQIVSHQTDGAQRMFPLLGNLGHPRFLLSAIFPYPWADQRRKLKICRHLRSVVPRDVQTRHKISNPLRNWWSAAQKITAIIS